MQYQDNLREEYITKPTREDYNIKPFTHKFWRLNDYNYNHLLIHQPNRQYEACQSIMLNKDIEYVPPELVFETPIHRDENNDNNRFTNNPRHTAFRIIRENLIDLVKLPMRIAEEQNIDKQENIRDVNILRFDSVVTKRLIRKIQTSLDIITHQRENIEAISREATDITELQRRNYSSCLFDIINIQNVNHIYSIILTFLRFLFKVDNFGLGIINK